MYSKWLHHPLLEQNTKHRSSQTSKQASKRASDSIVLEVTSLTHSSRFRESSASCHWRGKKCEQGGSPAQGRNHGERPITKHFSKPHEMEKPQRNWMQGGETKRNYENFSDGMENAETQRTNPAGYQVTAGSSIQD